MLYVVVPIFFMFLIAAGVLLYVVTPQSDKAQGMPLVPKAALIAGKTAWVLVMYVSCVFTMLKAQLTFALYFWRDGPKVLGYIASTLALVIILVGQTYGRKKRSCLRFILLPGLLFMATMPVIIRILAK